VVIRGRPLKTKNGDKRETGIGESGNREDIRSLFVTKDKSGDTTYKKEGVAKLRNSKELLTLLVSLSLSLSLSLLPSVIVIHGVGEK
jgi:hypothetical protein